MGNEGGGIIGLLWRSKEKGPRGAKARKKLERAREKAAATRAKKKEQKILKEMAQERAEQKAAKEEQERKKQAGEDQLEG